VSVFAPINLQSWVAEHRQLLKPPVGNKPIWDGDFLVMVVGGPNKRTDYHINPGGELFYQVEGDIVVRIIDDQKPRDVAIRQGELFLLPAGVPHSPQRTAGTVGLVVEVPKFAKGVHHLRWYCRSCNAVLHDFAFEPADLGTQIKTMIGEFNSSTALRTCKQCGAMFAVD
jgi:3-hydroxyanthranilate 3,4-dioxygenase